MQDLMVMGILAQAATVPSVEPRTTVGPGAGVPAPAVPAVSPTTGTGEGATTMGVAGTQQATTQDTAKPPGGLLGGLQTILPIIVMLGALYFILIRGQRKEAKRKKSLIEELKRGDRVMTIGGLVATVVSLDGEEVVLKIDESANVKARYRKSAIQEVLGGDEKK